MRFDRQVHCCGKQVRLLMRELHIQGRWRRRKFKATWRSFEMAPEPDLVYRRIVAQGPGPVWVADIKYA